MHAGVFGVLLAVAAAATPGAVEAQRPRRPTGPPRADRHAAERAARLQQRGVLEDDPSELRWEPQWERFRTAETIATGAMAASLLTLKLTLPEPDAPRWQQSMVLDEGIRDVMRPSSYRARRIAGGVSDLLFISLSLYPVVVDVGLAAIGRHRNWDVALQMLAINAQAFALTSLVTMVTKYATRRERPFGRRCDEADGQKPPGCEGSGRYRGFMSGHTSMAFTAAGLICAHNSHLDLYGDERTARAACITAFGAASAVGALRIVGDRHYASDVLVGAAVGLLSGYFMPKWLHYGGDGGPRDGGRRRNLSATVAPMASRNSVGIGVSGVW